MKKYFYINRVGLISGQDETIIMSARQKSFRRGLTDSLSRIQHSITVIIQHSTFKIQNN